MDKSVPVSYLSALISMVPTSIHAVHYADIVKNCAMNRRLLSVAGQVESIGYQNMPHKEAIDRVQKLVRLVSLQAKDDDVLNPVDMVNDAIDRYSLARTAKKYLKTGIASVDFRIGGLLPAEYVVIAARTSVGKTTFALQIARHIAIEKYALFISLEMSKEQITNKNVAALTGIPEGIISRGAYSEDQLGQINKSLGEISDLHLYVAEGNRTTTDIRRLIENQMNQTGLDIVFIDYLQKVRDKSAEDQYNRVGNISFEIALMTKDYNIPIVALAQLNRDAEYRTDHRPKLSDLRDSGRIEEDADMVGFLYRESYYKKDADCDVTQGEFHKYKDRLRGETGIIYTKYKDGLYS
jgi:replicative DNA helicase